MVMKENGYGFKAKAIARGKLKEFVGDNYSVCDRKNSQVLTLLGHEPYELEQIWDPLGIPRKNITTIEKNPKVYKMIQNANYGVKLAPKQSIDNFLTETDDDFDIINLDYQGYFNLGKLRNIEEISYRNLLRDKGILAHWHSGNRENEEAKLLHLGIGSSFLASVAELYGADTINEVLEKINGDLRETIPIAINSGMERGILHEEMNPIIRQLSCTQSYYDFLKNHENFKEKGKYFLEFSRLSTPKKNKMLKDPIFKREYEAWAKLRRKALSRDQLITQDEFEDYARAFHGTIGDEFAEEVIGRKVDAALKNMSQPIENSNALSVFLTHMIRRSRMEGYTLAEGEKYKYLSDGNTPMFLDIFKFLKDTQGPIPFKIKDGKIEFNPKDFNKKNVKEIIKYVEDRKLPEKYVLKHRELLTADPEAKDLTKEEVYELLREGKTTKEIIEIDPLQNPNTIRAYKANITMDEKGIKKGRRPKNKKLSKLEKTVKKGIVPIESQIQIQAPKVETKELNTEDVYSLLRKGKTKQEILEIDPSLNPRSVSAYQAHVTMENKGIKAGRPKKQEEAEHIDELSKEDAIWLLKNGISTKEILEAYPGAFDDYQLRSFKAHITRGHL